MKIRQMLDREKKPVKKEAKHNNRKKEEKPDIKMNPKQDEVDEARMVKLRGRFDPVVKTDAQKMAKHPMYKGNNSKLERDIRKKHGDKNVPSMQRAALEHGGISGQNPRRIHC